MLLLVTLNFFIGFFYLLLIYYNIAIEYWLVFIKFDLHVTQLIFNILARSFVLVRPILDLILIDYLNEYLLSFLCLFVLLFVYFNWSLKLFKFVLGKELDLFFKVIKLCVLTVDWLLVDLLSKFKGASRSSSQTRWVLTARNLLIMPLAILYLRKFIFIIFVINCLLIVIKDDDRIFDRLKQFKHLDVICSPFVHNWLLFWLWFSKWTILGSKYIIDWGTR